METGKSVFCVCLYFVTFFTKDKTLTILSMNSSKILSDKSKTNSNKNKNPKTKISKSMDGLNKSLKDRGKNTKDSDKSDSGKTFSDRDFAELAMNKEYGTAFDKFWKTVTDEMEKYPRESLPRSTQIDNKIMELQKRIRLNQAVLKSANERMKGISFATERENLSQWKEGLSFRNPSREELNRYEDVKALDFEIQTLRETKPDQNVFLRSSPGIVNFHETMEITLNMLDKIQKGDECDDYSFGDHNRKSTYSFDSIDVSNLVTVSDKD